MNSRLAMVLCLAALLWALPTVGAAAGDCPKEPDLPPAVQEALYEAQQLIDKGKQGQAAAKLAQWAAANPEAGDHRLSFMRGVLAYQAKQQDEAERQFRRSLELYGCHGPSAQNLALVLFERGKVAQAAEMMLRAYELAEKPDDELLYSAAAFYVSGGQARNGLPLLERLAAKEPAKPHWLTALVQCYMELKRPADAARVLDRLLRLEPGRVELWRLAAAIGVERKNYAAAAAALEVASLLDPPKTAAGWRQLGDVYRAAGAPLAAVERYKRAMGPAPSAADWDLLAQTYLSGNHLRQAREAALEAAKREPSAKRWELIGRMDMMQKDYARAYESFGRAARINDGQGRNSLMAGYAAWQMDKPELALEAFARAAKLATPGSTAAKEAQRNLETVRTWMANQRQAEQEPPDAPPDQP